MHLYESWRNFMKRNLNFILYIMALIVILIPMALRQSLGHPMNHLMESILLSVGLVLLLIGKIFVIKQKRRETGESIFLDLVICGCLSCMVIWMFIR